MLADEQPPAVTIPVAMLLIANAVLFAIGALLHGGVEIVPIDEPVVLSAVVLEIAAVLMLSGAFVGVVTNAAWARRVAGFANSFALIVVLAVAMLLGLDHQRSAAAMDAMQVLRTVFATVSLLVLYQTGRAQR